MSQTQDERRINHGTRSRYKAGCRCADCTVANSNYIAGLRDRECMEDAYTWRVIANSVAFQMDTEPERLMKACGLNGRTVAGILSGKYRHVTPYTGRCLRKLLTLLPSEGGDAY